MSHAVIDTLPRNLEFLIHETYNWFSKSTMRQIKYSALRLTVMNALCKYYTISNTR